MYDNILLAILPMQFTTNDVEITLLLCTYLVLRLLLLLPLYPSIFPPYVAFALGHSLFKIPLISLLLQEPVNELKSATIEPLSLLSVGICSSPYSLPECSPHEHTLLRVH